MPLPREKAELIDHVADAIRASGWDIVFESDEHPTRLLAFSAQSSARLLVYIWRLTPGGPTGVRPDGEFRIQMTGVRPPLTRGHGFKTLLLGYYSDLDVFVGFDVSRRPQQWGSSPSVQVRYDALRAASQNGFGFYQRHTRGNAELAVAFVPEAFMDYVARQSDLHLFADNKDSVAALQSAAVRSAAGERVDPDVVAGHGRRTVVKTVLARIGQQNFRDRILRAYNQRCATCGLQLKLIEAAHVIPVPVGGSNHTSNGIGMCKLHHVAYDNGLIGIDRRYAIVINEREVERLTSQNLAGGLDRFRRGLRAEMILPERDADRPVPDDLTRGMSLRGWDI